MEQILRFIVDHMEYLWTDYRYRITHSDVADHMGGWAEMHVDSDSLRLVFTYERSQLFADAVSLFDRNRSRVPIELVCDLLGAAPAMTAQVGPATPLQRGAYSAFLREHFSSIEAMYSAPHWCQSLDALKSLVASRAANSPVHDR